MLLLVLAVDDDDEMPTFFFPRQGLTHDLRKHVDVCAKTTLWLVTRDDILALQTSVYFSICEIDLPTQ